MKILTCEQTRELERKAVDSGISYLQLMQNAGEAAAKELIKSGLKTTDVIAVVCGKGNNGGDGFVAARYLYDNGYNPHIILSDGLPKTDEAKRMYKQAVQKYIPVTDFDNCLDIIKSATWVIDAVYGIGFKGELSPKFDRVLDAINGKVLAVDIPSGAVCDTGEVKRRAFKADVTVTFSSLKPAHILYPSAELCGDIRTAFVGIPDDIKEESPCMAVQTEKSFFKGVFRRSKNTHKGSYGTAVCVCGSYGMAGASVLSGLAALRSGAGLVKMCVPHTIYPIVADKLTEAVFAPYGDDDRISGFCKNASAVLIGCGMGNTDNTYAAVKDIINNTNCPVVIDADGINSICGHIDILRRGNIVITPHPLEFSRLSGLPVSEINSNRLQCARDFSLKNNVCTVLKGSNTVIALPDGELYVNPTGNPGMAKGGSGDVLAGITVSLLAQGIDIKTAVLCAAYVHGLAGDIAAEDIGEIAMLPTDMINSLGRAFREMMH